MVVAWEVVQEIKGVFYACLRRIVANGAAKRNKILGGN